MKKALSLFSGCGGLDAGLVAAGFKIAGCVEIEDDARQSLKLNDPSRPVAERGDVHAYKACDLLAEFELTRGNIALLAGGPPCQPFSKSRYWVNGDSPRLSDPRAKTLDAYMDVLEAALPEVVLLENVKGLSFNGKDEGVVLLKRLLEDINCRNHTAYSLQEFHINAAQYGVPQHRERVFFVAVKSGKLIEMPSITHGDTNQGATAKLLPYTTVWDAIGHLDTDDIEDSDLALSGKWANLLPSIPEGCNYQYHTPKGGGLPLFGWRTRFWSFLLKLAKNSPSWTLQAQPGPATGPFHWRNRRLSIDEMCRLQSLPAGHRVYGQYRSAQCQIGNAVPSPIGELLGLEILRQVFEEDVRTELKLVPKPRQDCPPPATVSEVPEEYLSLIGEHADHPGTGNGPGAVKRKTQKPNQGPELATAISSSPGV